MARVAARTDTALVSACQAAIAEKVHGQNTVASYAHLDASARERAAHTCVAARARRATSACGGRISAPSARSANSMTWWGSTGARDACRERPRAFSTATRGLRAQTAPCVIQGRSPLHRQCTASPARWGALLRRAARPAPAVSRVARRAMQVAMQTNWHRSRARSARWAGHQLSVRNPAATVRWELSPSRVTSNACPAPPDASTTPNISCALVSASARQGFSARSTARRARRTRAQSRAPPGGSAQAQRARLRAKVRAPRARIAAVRR